MGLIAALVKAVFILGGLVVVNMALEEDGMEGRERAVVMIGLALLAIGVSL